MYEKYPSHWAGLISLEENQRCPDISGIYHDEELSGTEWMSGDQYAPSLSWFFFSGEYSGEYPFYYVQIKHLDDGTLEIIAWNEEVRSKKIYPAEKYSCASGAIKIPYKDQEIDASEGAAGFVLGSYYLRKSTDGYLVIKDESLTLGWLVVSPITATYTGWHRFRPEGYQIERDPSKED
jgi:hypothetical protein